MKIAILYICTGKYQIFFKDFYASCEKYFLAEVEKTYYVFSDFGELDKYQKVRFSYKACEGFPNDSLFRFRTFLTVETELSNYDYIFFFNSNMKFIAPVDESFLPGEEDGYLCCLDAGYDRIYPHPCFYPYERNKQSQAFIPRGLKEYRYYHGAVNGGRTKEYLEMCHILKDNIDDDYQRGIIAIYHDESHINKYLSQHICKGLSCDYGVPEGKEIEGKTKLIIIDKTRYDSYFNKGRNNSLWGKLKKSLQKVFYIFQWYI